MLCGGNVIQNAAVREIAGLLGGWWKKGFLATGRCFSERWPNRSRLFGHGFWYIPVKKTVEHVIPISEHDQTPSKSIMRTYQIWWIFRNPLTAKIIGSNFFPQKVCGRKVAYPAAWHASQGHLIAWRPHCGVWHVPILQNPRNPRSFHFEMFFGKHVSVARGKNHLRKTTL